MGSSEVVEPPGCDPMPLTLWPWWVVKGSVWEIITGRFPTDLVDLVVSKAGVQEQRRRLSPARPVVISRRVHANGSTCPDPATTNGEVVRIPRRPKSSRD